MTTALKDRLNPAAVRRLAGQVAAIFPQFDAQQFERTALASLADLSLTERVRLLQTLLNDGLAIDLARDASDLRRLAASWPLASDAGWENYAAWPLIEMIGESGRDDPAQALSLLASFTHLFTAEFAMRWYVRNRLPQIRPIILAWTASESPHIRRLASECLRPRLPWGGHIKALQSDPVEILPVLEQLRDDPSRYVQKSVGNNLNDISKDHPQRVLQICERWWADAPASRQQIVKRALRTLIKSGEPAVFPLLGYTDNPALVTQFEISPVSIALGESVELELTLRSRASDTQKINIDYRLVMPGHGSQTRDKVFKWQTVTLLPGQTIQLQKAQAFAQLSTRRYYGGEYDFEILVNGVPMAQASLQLTVT